MLLWWPERAIRAISASNVAEGGTLEKLHRHPKLFWMSRQAREYALRRVAPRSSPENHNAFDTKRFDL